MKTWTEFSHGVKTENDSLTHIKGGQDKAGFIPDRTHAIPKGKIRTLFFRHLIQDGLQNAL